MEVLYTNTFTRGENEDQEDTDFNQAAINWIHRLTYQWELGMGVSGTRTNYQISPDEERGRAYARLTRLMGPNMRTYGQLSYAINRATDEDDQLTDDSRNYETLSFEAGINQDVSRRLSWSFGAGWSYGQRQRPVQQRGGQGLSPAQRLGDLPGAQMEPHRLRHRRPGAIRLPGRQLRPGG